jgi:proteasome alpha subunit
MIDEPYRWVEAIQNRREYIEDQLREGSPVVLVRYADGLLVATMGRETRKIYEVYDRIAFAALGHPADIEKLRLAAIDLAHIEGFSRAVSDVSLRRLVTFAMSPALKSAFEQVFSAPYVVRTLLAELGATAEEDFLCKLDYDGSFSRSASSLKTASRSFEVLGGTKHAEDEMARHLDKAGVDGKLSVEEALKIALQTWAIGRLAAAQSGEEKKADELERDFRKLLDSELESNTVEAAVLDRSLTGPNKFRLLDEKQVRAVTKEL